MNEKIPITAADFYEEKADIENLEMKKVSKPESENFDPSDTTSHSEKISPSRRGKLP